MLLAAKGNDVVVLPVGVYRRMCVKATVCFMGFTARAGEKGRLYSMFAEKILTTLITFSAIEFMVLQRLFL